MRLQTIVCKSSQEKVSDGLEAKQWIITNYESSSHASPNEQNGCRTAKDRSSIPGCSFWDGNKYNNKNLKYNVKITGHKKEKAVIVTSSPNKKELMKVKQKLTETSEKWCKQEKIQRMWKNLLLFLKIKKNNSTTDKEERRSFVSLLWIFFS